MAGRMAKTILPKSHFSFGEQTFDNPTKSAQPKLISIKQNQKSQKIVQNNLNAIWRHKCQQIDKVISKPNLAQTYLEQTKLKSQRSFRITVMQSGPQVPTNRLGGF